MGARSERRGSWRAAGGAGHPPPQRPNAPTFGRSDSNNRTPRPAGTVPRLAGGSRSTGGAPALVEMGHHGSPACCSPVPRARREGEILRRTLRRTTPARSAPARRSQPVPDGVGLGAGLRPRQRRFCHRHLASATRRRGDAAEKNAPMPRARHVHRPAQGAGYPRAPGGGGPPPSPPPPRPRDISSSPYPPSPYPGPVSAWPRGAQPRRRPPGNSHSETRRREPGGGARGGRGGRGRRAGGVPPPGGQGRRAEGGGFPPGAGGEGRGGAPRRGWRRGTARERWQGRWRGRRAQR